ncbi:F-box protein SKP2A-like [Impatiens glandulifera]|uniref:F-box protein SKP2A-like n=1 Tax=Impatiens glandulifera TaxID=253017 RepID=UPI001FB18540|nr:F-box protein SKP2A-like [Impatiens glandulifera]
MAGREVGYENEDLKSGSKKMIRPRMKSWNDIPLEILLIIVSMLDDPSVFVALCVCSGWRNGIFKALTHLNLSWCNNHMNSLVISLIPKFQNIKSLVLKQVKPQLIDNAVMVVAKFCPKLTDLDLTNSLDLSKHSIIALASGCPNLINLNLSDCSTIEDDICLMYLASSCTKLYSLNLSNCNNFVTDNSLMIIAGFCNELQILNVSGCTMVSDEGVTSLANGCSEMRALTLDGCLLVTDVSVLALSEKCPHLNFLEHSDCKKITIKSSNALAKIFMNKITEILKPMKKYLQEIEEEEKI